MQLKIAAANEFFAEQDCVIDSLPIMLAVRGRAAQTKVAGDNANVGYCTSKDIYYHGVKMHILARKKYESLPLLEILTVTKASEHDLPVLQAFESKTAGNLFADLAYKDQTTERIWAEKGVIICTPDKKQKNSY